MRRDLLFISYRSSVYSSTIYGVHIYVHTSKLYRWGLLEIIASGSAHFLCTLHHSSSTFYIVYYAWRPVSPSAFFFLFNTCTEDDAVLSLSPLRRVGFRGARCVGHFVVFHLFPCFGVLDVSSLQYSARVPSVLYCTTVWHIVCILCTIYVKEDLPAWCGTCILTS